MKKETSKCPKCGKPKFNTIRGGGEHYNNIEPINHKGCKYAPSKRPGPNPNINTFINQSSPQDTQQKVKTIGQKIK